MTIPTTQPAPTAPVRDAATVALLRDGATGIEAWLLTRAIQMVFASGMTVFPGGRVDPGDATLPWCGRAPGLFADDFGCDESTARSLVGAAVRETFEETGVLLTVPPAAHADAQPDVETGRRKFADLLAEYGLAIDADAVRPWARWITPVGEVRRYDTRFFVAALPAAGVAADLTTESSMAAWIPIDDALDQYQRNVRNLLPPTLDTLRSLATFRSVDEVLAAASQRSLAPIEPIVVADDDGPHVELPDGRRYPMPRPS